MILQYKQVIYDRDPRFTSLFWKALFEILGSKLLYSSVYYLQTDGQTEWINKVVEQILRTMASDVDAKWVSKLSFVEFAINLLVYVSTEKTPFKLVYGQQVQNIVDQLDGLRYIESAQQIVNNISKLSEEAKTKLLQAQESYSKYYNIFHHYVEFPINNKILLSTKNQQLSGTQKLQQCFVGPLAVAECIGGQAYKLQLLTALQKLHNIFHVSLLKPYVTGGDGVKQPQYIIIDRESEWEVETVLRYWCHHGIQ